MAGGSLNRTRVNRDPCGYITRGAVLLLARAFASIPEIIDRVARVPCLHHPRAVLRRVSAAFTGFTLPIIQLPHEGGQW